jgi:hypothetical protein
VVVGDAPALAEAGASLAKEGCLTEAVSLSDRRLGEAQVGTREWYITAAAGDSGPPLGVAAAAGAAGPRITRQGRELPSEWLRYRSDATGGTLGSANR